MEVKNPAQSPVMLYTEQTPNPESLKFVTNRMLYKSGTADFREEDQALAQKWSPLATALFELDSVKGVYISNNFVTVTKEHNFDWADIMLKLKEFIKAYVTEGKEVISEGYEAAKAAEEQEALKGEYTEEDAEIVVKIKAMIEKYVKPAVEMDGGNIVFKSFRRGVVNVEMQGSCSGCPSSTVTLKSGIENMLRRMVPQVKEVNAVMG